MIGFPCHCGHRFSVDEQMAGSMIQCPACGRLNDVPTLSDLKALNEDGTYKDTPLAPPDDPARDQELLRAFRRSKVDDRGEEYDLRPTMADIARAGAIRVNPIEEDYRPAKPKYDPVTGELIDPLAVQAEKPIAAIPAAPPTIHYATGTHAQPDHVSAWKIPLEMFRPWNLAVLIVVVVAHMMITFVAIAAALGIFFIAAFGVLFWLLILAHFGNVPDDTGPGLKDELPGILRQAEFRDDIWNPLVALVASLMMAFGPAGFALSFNTPVGNAVAATLTAVGALIWPALLLTLTTSGTVLNLRPDRLLRVIRVTNYQYLAAAVLGTAALGMYGIAFVDIILSILSRGQVSLSEPLGLSGWTIFAMLLVGIYMMHWYGWYLGNLYRQHHEQFDWILQRHIPRKLLQRTLPAAAQVHPPHRP